MTYKVVLFAAVIWLVFYGGSAIFHPSRWGEITTTFLIWLGLITGFGAVYLLAYDAGWLTLILAAISVTAWTLVGRRQSSLPNYRD